MNPFDPKGLDELPDILSIFPLADATLLPGTALPLNIFEPRYLNLILDAFAADRLIGMLQPDPRFVKEVWSGSLELPPGRPANQEIQVTFSYNESGIMQCAFVDKESGKKTEVDLNVAAASDSASHEIDKFTVE